MPHITVSASIHFSPWAAGHIGPDSTGIWASSAAEVVELGKASQLPVSLNEGVAKLEVNLAEQDPRLAKLYEAIWQKYGLTPSPWHIIPVAERHKYFGVHRKVAWNKEEIDACDYLRLGSSQIIATHHDPSEEELLREDYVVENDARQKTKTQFGHFMPFHALAVAEPMRSHLLEAGLKGLHLPPVVFVPPERKVHKPLWALKSHVILPQALNPLVNSKGEEVVPNTQWWCWWEDGGRRPEVLRYDRYALEALGSFDIAMTLERVSTSRVRSFRWCIVSQRFREVLTNLKVKGVDYMPVELV